MLINIQITVLLYILLLRFSLLYMVKKRQFFIESCMSAGKRDYIQHMVIIIINCIILDYMQQCTFCLYCLSLCLDQ